MEGVHVDTEGISRMNKLTADNRKARIVYMPIYKSYSDPLLMHYLQYWQNMELGFTFGNYEDSPKIGFINRLIKRIGTILIRRNPRNSLSNVDFDSEIDQDIVNYVN